MNETTDTNELLHEFSEINNELIRTQRELSQKNAELHSLNQKLADKNRQLEQALAEIKTLKKLLPICMYCKKVKDDNANGKKWISIDSYITKNTDTKISHGLCDQCRNEHYSI